MFQSAYSPTHSGGSYINSQLIFQWELVTAPEERGVQLMGRMLPINVAASTVVNGYSLNRLLLVHFTFQAVYSSRLQLGL